MADAPTHRHVEHVMGTVVTIVAAARPAARCLDDAIDDVVKWLHLVDATFSTFRLDSAVSRLNRGETTVAQCPADVASVLALCDEICAETGGYFTARWNGGIDPTGLVKGWSIERASAMLVAAGIDSHAISGGGDVRVRGAAIGPRPWRIGIADPDRPDRCLAAVTRTNGAVATSGVRERGLHIVDPFTGRAADHWASLTVIGPDLTRADAYATAAVAMGTDALDWLGSMPGWQGVAADQTGRVHLSGGAVQCSAETALATTSSDTISAEIDSYAISSLARGVSGMVSVGENAVEFVVDTYR